MTSLLRADSVSPRAGGTPRNLPRGVAAAWSVFNGTGTIALGNSLNISSLTDQGVGVYLNSFTSAMTSIQFPVGATGNQFHSLTAASSASSAQVFKFDQTHTAADASVAGCIVTGDLA